MIVPSLKSNAGLLQRALHLAFAHQLKEELEAERISRERFAEVLATSIDVFKVAPEDIRKKFNVTAPTVSRWRNEDAAPGDFLRMSVVAWLAEEIEKMVPDLREPANSLLKQAKKIAVDHKI